MLTPEDRERALIKLLRRTRRWHDPLCKQCRNPKEPERRCAHRCEACAKEAAALRRRERRLKLGYGKRSLRNGHFRPGY